MKTKISILIAAGLFLAGVSKAQFPGAYSDNRVVIHADAEFGYGNAHVSRDAYHDRRYWKMDEYERFCFDHPGYRINRREFYRNRYIYYNQPCFPPKKIIPYRY